MAKMFKGAIKLASTIQQTGAQPLDDRVVVATVSDLYNSFGTAIYNGMLVAVAETGDVYMLKDDTKVGEAAGWKLIGGDTAADLTKVKEDVAKNKATIGVINGDANTEGSFKKGDADTLAAAKQYTDDAKTSLLGDAAAEYNTLGKLEDKIQAEASRADAAEKANAAAAAAAQKTIDDFKGRTEGFATAAQGAKADAADTLSKANKDKIDIINGTGDGSITKAVSDAKTELIGNDTTADTIKHAEKLATDASKKVDTEIGKLDVTGNTSKAVKGVTVTVDETDGKVIPPVVSIADGTLTGAATDGNLVTGTAVKKYVDDKVSEINTAAGELGTRVTTLEGKVGKLDATHTTKDDGSFNTVAEEVTTGIAGIAETSKANKAGSDVVVTVTTKSGSVSSVAVDSSVLKKAVTDGDASVKSDLLGDAAAEYNTLGKLEDKIQAEASTARAEEKKNADAIAAETTRAMAAEKKNADAAAAAKTAADNAQATANTKVASVTAKDGETAIEVDNTTATTPKISLKLDNDGNVQFVQTAKGLKGSVEIPEATVTGVKADDKFLSLADKLVSADVSIAYDATDKKIYLYGKDKNKANAVSSIDCTDFIKDGMLDSASLVTNPAGQSAGTYIKLTWNTDGGKAPMYINVTSLIDIYTAKPDGGLVLEDHAFSVDYEKVAKKGDLDNEITRAKAAEEANAAAIAAETTRATDAEAALLGTDGDAATKDTIKGAKQAVKDLESQIKAEAVTLTIPDDDPYITASKDATTNKYTIKSKLDTDGTTPLVDVKIDTKLTDKINSLDVTGNKSEDVAGIAVTVNETDGKVSKPIVEVTPGSVAAGNASVVTGGAVYTAVDDAKSALIGTKGDAATEDTIYGAKQAAAAAKAAADNASAKVDTEIGKLDVTGNTSDAVKGVTVTVNETDGKVIKPVVSIADGTIGGVSDANLVTGGTVKTYVDTAINDALVWHDIA